MFKSYLIAAVLFCQGSLLRAELVEVSIDAKIFRLVDPSGTFDFDAHGFFDDGPASATYVIDSETPDILRPPRIATYQQTTPMIADISGVEVSAESFEIELEAFQHPDIDDHYRLIAQTDIGLVELNGNDGIALPNALFSDFFSQIDSQAWASFGLRFFPADYPGVEVRAHASDVFVIPARQILAGDADRDLDYDFDDIQAVLSAGKFETGAPATWGEGDFDGSPGLLISPPIGNGVFDFDDVLAGLAIGHYETGPYAAVPEPSADMLGIAGVLLILPLTSRRRCDSTPQAHTDLIDCVP